MDKEEKINRIIEKNPIWNKNIIQNYSERLIQLLFLKVFRNIHTSEAEKIIDEINLNNPN